MRAHRWHGQLQKHSCIVVLLLAEAPQLSADLLADATARNCCFVLRHLMRLQVQLPQVVEHRLLFGLVNNLHAVAAKQVQLGRFLSRHISGSFT